MMRANWFGTIFFCAFAFVMGVLAQRDGYVPVSTDTLVLGTLAAPVVLGFGVVGYVVIFMVIPSRRHRAKQTDEPIA